MLFRAQLWGGGESWRNRVYPENGFALVDRVFKSFHVDHLVSCYISCASRPSCQSLNYNPGRGGGTWPMFGYRGAAEGLKSWPCLGQGYAKNPTLCRTTASISRPCLGQVTKCTLSGLHEFKLFNKSFKSEKSCSMRLKPICILMTL